MDTITTAVSVITLGSDRVVHSVTADFVFRHIQPLVNLVQYDISMPVIAIKLREAGQVYTLQNGSACNLRVRKPDGTYAYNPALGCDSTRSIAYFEITQNMSAAHGCAMATVEVVLNGKVAASSMLKLVFETNPIPYDAIESSSEWKTITDLYDTIVDATLTPVSTVAQMTDTSKVYLYTGTESGYNQGHMYYYNGSTWIDAGIAETDETLTVSDMAADAKATGDRITALETQVATNTEDISDVKDDLNELTILDTFRSTQKINKGVDGNTHLLVNRTGNTTITNDNLIYANHDIRLNVETGYMYMIFTFLTGEWTTANYVDAIPWQYGEYIVPKGTWFTVQIMKTDRTAFLHGENDKYVVTFEDIAYKEDVLYKIPYDFGKNLFDKTGEFTKITKGFYRDYRDGVASAVAAYEFITYAVKGDTDYAINTSNVHVCFFSDENATTYISGFLSNDTNGYTFNTPSNAKTMTISIRIDAEDSFQVQYGTVSTTYESFKKGLDAGNVLGGCLYVGTDKKYTTIQSAINAASDGDIIFVDAGVYEEALDAVAGNKFLHFIGAGKDATIVRYAGDNYYYPPLEIAKGIVENMSFITTATQAAEGAISSSYCVHIDYDEETNNTLQFINCYFESPNRYTVGIGLRENFTVNFTNCIFKSGVDPVYCHEQQASNKTGQRIELVGCSIQCTGAESCIRLQESVAYTGNEMTILMQRCIAKANGVSGNNIIIGVTYPNAQIPTGSNYLNLAGWHLDTMSALNNESILNA